MDEKKTLPNLKFKILIIGDSAVGKTSLLLKYVDNLFSETHMATIGVEYKEKIIKTPKYNVILNLWDTAGQERFKSITKNFFNNTNGIVFVYDITNRETFDGVKNWIKDAEPYGKFESVICGNKNDLENNRQVPIGTLKEYGLKKKMEIFETSAKTGDGVNEAFEKLVELILNSRSDEDLIKEFGVSSQKHMSLTKSKKKIKKDNCCNK
jgi:small GTP-binding protein